MEVKFTGAVAFIDILGFSDHFEPDTNTSNSLSLEEIRDEVIGKVMSSAVHAYMIVQHDFDRFTRFSGKNERMAVLNWLSFSDSVILYLPLGKHFPFSSPEEIIESMVYTCSLLMARSIWVNIPLRGAIAYGECLISHDPVYALGKPFMEAYNLEKKQMWAGVALADSALEHYDISNSNQVVEYDVLCKYDGQIRATKLAVVNWPENSMGPSIPKYPDMESGEQPDWEACFSCKSENKQIRKDVQMKKDNTKEFFIHQDANRSGAGVFFGPEQRDYDVDWRKDYEWLRNVAPKMIFI